MRIVISIYRQRKGDHHSPLIITDQYHAEKHDDVQLQNCGVEFYNAWRETIDAAEITGKVLKQHRGSL